MLGWIVTVVVVYMQVFDSSADQRHIDTPLFTVQSIASTARVKWRPHWTFHLSSCAQLLDFSVNVWDIRRPYIPVAVFSRHKDVVTGVLYHTLHQCHQVFLVAQWLGRQTFDQVVRFPAGA